MVQPNSFNQDLISEIFGQDPELSFLGQLSQSGLRPNQQRALRGRVPDFLQRLRQSAGRSLVQGNIPTLLTNDFFGNLNFQEEFGRLTPQQRGQDRSRFSPRTRFRF